MGVVAELARPSQAQDSGETFSFVGSVGVSVKSHGYGQPHSGYGVPHTSYSVPHSGYGVPQTGYGVPSYGNSYGHSGYGSYGYVQPKVKCDPFKKLFDFKKECKDDDDYGSYGYNHGGYGGYDNSYGGYQQPKKCGFFKKSI